MAYFFKRNPMSFYVFSDKNTYLPFQKYGFRNNACQLIDKIAIVVFNLIGFFSYFNDQ